MTEYYSTKQIADSLNISKQRVYRCIKSNHIKEVHRDTVKGNTVLMYDKASIDRIKQLLCVSDEVHHDTVDDTVNDTLYDTLLKQLEIKDNQIKELNERLKESQKALDQEQQLHLLSKQRILELETVQADEEEPQNDIESESNSKNFWQRFFHK